MKEVEEEVKKWRDPDAEGTINVPDYLDKLFNAVGMQMRFHKFSDKNEVQTIADIVYKAEQFFSDQFKPQWIPVTESLPDDEFWYRVLIDGKHHILPFCCFKGKWYEYNESKPTDRNVTHYQKFEDLT